MRSIRLSERTVVAYRADVRVYPARAPFSPHEAYPESPFGALASEENGVYRAVRACLQTAGLDGERYGMTVWNPLRGLIHPGDTVLLKPNLIKECHPRDPDGWQYVLTHGSVVRAVADYVWKALEGKGRIIAADAPQTDSSFDAIVRVLGLDRIRDFYRGEGLDFQLLDLRQEQWVNRDGVIVDRKRLPGDPGGSLAFDLGAASEFVGHPGAGRYYGADYDTEEVNRHHRNGRHEYLIARSAITSDVIFSLPKLKTHKKTGITVSLKNLVGINADKNWLPHHSEGSPAEGGDEHPSPTMTHRAERGLVSWLRALSLRMPGVGPWLHRYARRAGLRVFGDTEDVIRSGNWWGNDTAWRMCLDLNKIILYGNPDGTLRHGVAGNRKRHYVLVDGIIAGEGRGPMNPDPVPAGLLLFGVHPASVDAGCAVLMGYDPERIPLIWRAFRCDAYPVADWDWRDVELVSNLPEWNAKLPDVALDATFRFEPHFGWKGHIERGSREESEQWATSKRSI